MKKFATIFNGEITSVVSAASDWDFHDGELLQGVLYKEVPLETDLIDLISNWYYKDGFKQKPPQPREFHWFDLESESWIPDLAKAREVISQKWNRKRIELLALGYKQGDHTYYCDDVFLAELQAAVSLQRATFNVRTKEQELLVLDPFQQKNLLESISKYRQEIFTLVWDKKDSLQTLTTIEDILNASPE